MGSTNKSTTMKSSLTIVNGSTTMTADRPIERVHFATERARHAFNRIRRMLSANAEKLERYRSFGQISGDVKKIVSATKTDVASPTRPGKKRSFRSCDSDDESVSKRSRIGGTNARTDPFIASLGPIPSVDSKIFENMIFVICNARDVEEKGEEDAEDTVFFCEDRLTVQINMGGGKVYDSVELVPPEDHARTKLITNAPSLHPQRVRCLKAGIPAYSHVWIVRCCQKNKTLDPSRHAIPAVENAH